MSKGREEESGTLYRVSFKKRIVDLIKIKGNTVNSISYKYKIPPSTIQGWLEKSERVENKEIFIKMETAMKDQEEKIKQLQAALSDAHLKLMLYEKMIEIAKEEDGIEFKKNSNTGEYELVRLDKASKSSVR